MADAKLSARILDAVCSPECPLSAEARHLVMVMLWAADGKTAKGFKSQAVIAGMVGKSVRQVRRLIDVVNATPGSPVTILRSARFRKDGRGRTSDEYEIQLTNRTPMSSCSTPSTGRQCPNSQADQPDAHVPLKATTNRTSENVQPDIGGTTNRTPTSGEGSTRRSTKRSTLFVRWTRVPTSWEPKQEHSELAKDLGVDFALELSKFRDHEFASAKKDPDGAFRNWLRNSKKFQTRPSLRYSQPQRGIASHVETGSLEDWGEVGS